MAGRAADEAAYEAEAAAMEARALAYAVEGPRGEEAWLRAKAAADTKATVATAAAEEAQAIAKGAAVLKTAADRERRMRVARLRPKVASRFPHVYAATEAQAAADARAAVAEEDAREAKAAAVLKTAVDRERRVRVNRLRSKVARNFPHVIEKAYARAAADAKAIRIARLSPMAARPWVASLRLEP